MAKVNQKHKTVGVSFNPQIRKSANLRSRQLGVTFSRYVSLCVEAEIAGMVPVLDSARGEHSALWSEVDRLEQTMDERLRSDVAALLQRADISFVQQAVAGRVNADFFVSELPASACAPEADSGAPLRYSGAHSAAARDGLNGAESHSGVAIECRYPSPTGCAAVLGKAILLQQVFTHVLLCVPYLSVFEPELLAVFAQQGITVVTPDTLLEALRSTL